jgi:cell division transport system permease protein
VDVRARGLTLAGARDLAKRLQAVPGAAEVDDGAVWVARLETLLRRGRTAGLGLLALLALGTAVLVSNTLRMAVYARRDEIDIMKLVGATDTYVGAPILLEGALQGLVGALLAAAALWGAAEALLPRLQEALPIAARLARADLLPAPLLAWLVAGGAALGLVASALALRRFLRRPGG